MVVVDDADVAVLSLVGTIDVDEIIGPEKKQSYVYLNFYLYDYDGGFETQMHPDFLGGIKSMC